MARPKGVIQKRNESKYWLPEGVTLKEGQKSSYNKETKLIFIDVIYGEFISYFKALQLANASTHPDAVKKRRELTNIERFGGTNPSHSKEVREKAHKTMENRYGKRHALQNEEFLKKSQETLFSNYGVYTTMASSELCNKQKETLMKNHGVDNPMKSPKIIKKFREEFKIKYGEDNPGKCIEFKEKAIKTMTGNDGFYHSKGELSVLNYINSLGFIDAKTTYISGNIKNKKDVKQLDIFLKELNIAIEYNGSYMHSELFKKSNYHLNKTKLAEQNNIRLIHIFDHEWKERNKQVKSFLKSALGKNEIRIGARNTEISELNKQETDEFLEKYHILGKCQYKHSIGLKYNNEIVCLITLGKHHNNNDSKEIILNRYIGKENITVSGGLSKLCKYAKNKYGELHTWIDLRWSNGSNWLKSGWSIVSIGKPDYFYYNKKNGKVINKTLRRKNKIGTPSDVTEHEQALVDGLVRVYDCGKIKLIYKG